MAFLTKKEQSLIRVINSNTKLTANERDKMVQKINDAAGLRQHGWRLPVREFIQAMAIHQTDQILKRVQ